MELIETLYLEFLGKLDIPSAEIMSEPVTVSSFVHQMHKNEMHEHCPMVILLLATAEDLRIRLIQVCLITIHIKQ